MRSIYYSPLLLAALAGAFKFGDRASNVGPGEKLKVLPCKFTPNNFFSTTPDLMGTWEEMDAMARKLGYYGCELLIASSSEVKK